MGTSASALQSPAAQTAAKLTALVAQLEPIQDDPDVLDFFSFLASHSKRELQLVPSKMGQVHYGAEKPESRFHSPQRNGYQVSYSVAQLLECERTASLRTVAE